MPAVIALVLWRLSLLHVGVSNLGDYGLPPALPIGWYLALALAVAGAVWAITARRTSGPIMVCYVVVVAVILFGTIPLLSAQPQYAWVYKHIGVVRYLETYGKVNPQIDIYNRWPGFFALAAVFSQIAGRSNPESYAGWAELIFLALDAVLVIAAVKVVVRDIRIAAGAGLFFVITNWVGQTYYSPQAFAFLLALALIVVMLRQLRPDRAGYSRRLTRLIERVGRTPQLAVPVEGATKWPRWAAIAAVLSLDAAIVASHQLTPYALLVSVALLMIVGVVRPWWLLPTMAVMAFAYLAPNFQFIQHHYGLFTSIDPANNLYVEKYKQVPTAGKVFNTNAQLVLIAALYVLSLCAAIRLLRRGLLARSLPLAVLAVSPFAVLLGQNYGGEASLRIILFSSPWCVALISWALATVTWRRTRSALTMLVAVIFTGLFVPSFLGQAELNIISPPEVRASEWFYYHAKPKSVLVLAAPGFPYRYGGTYPEFSGPEGDANPNLLSRESFQRRQLGAYDIPAVIERVTNVSKYGYVVFTKDETAYAQVLGITPPGALGNLQAAVARSPAFKLWYGSKDVQIYELVEGWRAKVDRAARISRTVKTPSRGARGVRIAHARRRRSRRAASVSRHGSARAKTPSGHRPRRARSKDGLSSARARQARKVGRL
jgi:hypothetical protein